MKQTSPSAHRSLRVAVVTETYPPEIGGAAMCVRRFVEALVARGHLVEVIRPRQSAGDRPGADDDMPALLTRPLAIGLHPGLQLGRPEGRRLLARWRAERPDVVHVATEGPLGLSALRAARRLGLPLSSSFHTNFHSFSRYYGLGAVQALGLAYMRWFHNRAACTMVPTAQTRDALHSAGFRGLAVVPRGVDIGLFTPARRSEELRRAWGAGPGDPVALHVGRLAPEKNVPLAIEAFRALQREAPRARMVLVGEGPERGRLERANPDLVFAGMRRGEDLASHYASGDLFLFPSLSETFGNVTLEAMASGLAVVAYDDAAAHEHIRPFETGLLAAPGRADLFLAAAADLARDPQLMRRLRRGAVKAAAEIGWDAVGRAFERLVCRVAAGGALETAGRPSPVGAAAGARA
jgi:glycosyltransferase involved in cell wall biosynthesis